MKRLLCCLLLESDKRYNIQLVTSPQGNITINSLLSTGPPKKVMTKSPPKLWLLNRYILENKFWMHKYVYISTLLTKECPCSCRCRCRHTRTRTCVCSCSCICRYTCRCTWTCTVWWEKKEKKKATISFTVQQIMITKRWIIWFAVVVSKNIKMKSFKCYYNSKQRLYRYFLWKCER
jgi:hypothetical protein